MLDAAGSGLALKAGAWISTARPTAMMNLVMVVDDMRPLLTQLPWRLSQNQSLGNRVIVR
jgi:hypothetical protein